MNKILNKLLSWRPDIGAARLALAAALVLALAYNLPLWRFLSGQGDIFLALRVFAVVASFYAFVLGLLAAARLLRPALTLLVPLSAAASYFMLKYGIFIDVNMIRNVAQTDRAEAGDLMSPALLLWLLVAGVLPVVLIWRLRVAAPRNFRAAALGLRLPALSLAVLAAVLWGSLQQLAPFYRLHREVRHIIVPYNVIGATEKYVRTDLLPRPAAVAFRPSPATLELRAPGAPRRVVVLVVGETARAENFGLGGYARDTTPRLARRDGLVYFSDFSSCGTETAVSVPCLFSSLKRRDFDVADFGAHDNLLQLTAKAGLRAVWIDNDSGCKGTCAGAEMIAEKDLARLSPDLCPGGECYDGALLPALAHALARDKGDLFVVLHQKGSHGPLYHRRVPEGLARFQPVCRDPDLSACSHEELINAYDNTLDYTDRVLDGVLGLLSGEPNAAMFYVSDHGESLGEAGMYLHGAPYMLAPSQQTHVPAVLWMSPGYAQARGFDAACLVKRAGLPRSHDNVFATMLEMNGIATPALQPADSLMDGCRRGIAVVGAAASRGG